MEILLSIVSIITSIISIFVALIVNDHYLSITLMIINLILLFILILVMIPDVNRSNTYKNIIKNNRYFSLIYMNYIDLHNHNKKCKVRNLIVKILINKQDDKITDTRCYSFSCKSKAKANNILLSFLNETGEISSPKVEIGSKATSISWEEVGKDTFFKSLRDIIKNVNIKLHGNTMQRVKFEYSVCHESVDDGKYIYIFYPKMFFSHSNIMRFEIKVDDRKQHSFQLVSIGKDDEKSEGLFDSNGDIYYWEGRVNKNRLYIIKGEDIN